MLAYEGRLSLCDGGTLLDGKLGPIEQGLLLLGNGLAHWVDITLLDLLKGGGFLFWRLFFACLEWVHHGGLGGATIVDQIRHGLVDKASVELLSGILVQLIQELDGTE